MNKKKRDIIYGIVLIVFSIFNIIYAQLTIHQNVVEYTLARPDRYMQLWLIILLALSIALLVRALKSKDESKGLPIVTKMAVFTILMFFAYLLALPKIGFDISSFIFIAITSIVFGLNMGKPKKSKKEMIIYIIKMLVFAGLMTIGSGLLFRNVLHVRLPKFKLW